MGKTKRSVFCAVVTFVAVVSLTMAAGAGAAQGPWWRLSSEVRPASLSADGEGTIVARASNIGDGPVAGVVTLRDVLPAGLAVQGVSFHEFPFGLGGADLGPEGELSFFNLCKVSVGEVECSTLEFLEPLNPYEYVEMRIAVKATSLPSGGKNRVEVGGPGTPSASLEREVPVGASPPAFGAEDFALVPEDEGGTVDTQAGSHPFQLTTVLTLNQTSEPSDPPALPKDLRFSLPPGLVGNATALPQCSDVDFRHVVQGGLVDLCPDSTVVGVASISFFEPEGLGVVTWPVPLFNLVPERGEPARFGFEIVGSPVTLDTSVRTGGDYGVTVSVSNITQLTNFISSQVTFWGVPGDPRHDHSRGWSCLAGNKWGAESGLTCNPAKGAQVPFLTLPTSCALPFAPTVQGDSWPRRATPTANPESVGFPARSSTLHDQFGRELEIGGCDRLPFAPTIQAAPDVKAASTPTGLTVGVHVPQEVNNNPGGLASSSVRDINVALPAGVTLNPAGADGLEACSETQIGYLAGQSTPPADLHFRGTLSNPFCPDGAKVGTVTIKTPLLADPLEGAVYLAAQNANPFGSLIAMYIVAEDPVSGTIVKLPGEVSLNQTTGQVSASFLNNPQLPFEEADLHFFGGERAPLSTPPLCGAYTTSASFRPWSDSPPAQSSSTFDIVTGPNGGACRNPLPFSPSLTAGTTSTQAGGFSPFTLTMGREDGQQSLRAITLHMPPGISGLLTGVKLCGEAQADAGTCGPDSEIGQDTVSAGLGGDPITVTGAKVYITGPYEGAPYGLSIVNPAKAGPFDLAKDTPCDCIVNRAKIEVDPITAALTVTTDTSGPYAIPTMLDGIPLQIKHVNVTIDRPRFTFNPTNCNPLSITGSLTSSEGATSSVSVPLQVTNCAVLGFKPAFSVSTSGKTSRSKGASLHVKLAYPKASFGSQANIAKVKVNLPRQLPSQLKTLKLACADKTFEANPAACDPESRIGTAKATTPLLPVPLTGPVYFVSHGGAKFPELVIVLSGYGTTVQLHAETFISKTGITSSTFRTIPDVPVGTFELTLPQGKFPALAAPGNNLCKEKLKMPTAFTAQNGVQIKQSTPITVTGCAKKKARHKKR